MSGRQMDEDASIADLPWASVFDPAANIRALSAIQARGFRAATEVVDRFVRMAARGFEDSRGESGAQAGDRGDAGYPEADELLASWQTMVGQLGRSIMSATAGPGAGVDLVAKSVDGEVRLAAGGSGVVAVEVWLHNRGPTEIGDVSLRVGDLLTHDGAVFPAAALQFEPGVVTMPARCSRGVVLQATVSSEHRPGRYRGTILAEGHADVWLPLVLDIDTPVS